MSDLIDRSALLKELESIKNRLQMMDDTQTADKIMTGLFRATVCIKDAPAVDAVPVVHSYWERGAGGYMRCHECGHRGSGVRAKYCSHCGARMDGKDEEHGIN